MTPFMLSILLHYGSRLDEFPQANTPAFASSMNQLVPTMGLLKERHPANPPPPDVPPYGAWELTERGKVYITMILETPLPEQCWLDPRGALYDSLKKAVADA